RIPFVFEQLARGLIRRVAVEPGKVLRYLMANTGVALFGRRAERLKRTVVLNAAQRLRSCDPNTVKGIGRQRLLEMIDGFLIFALAEFLDRQQAANHIRAIRK